MVEVFTDRLESLAPASLASELSVRVLGVFCSLGLPRHQAQVRRILVHILGTVLIQGIDLEDNNVVR